MPSELAGAGAVNVFKAPSNKTRRGSKSDLESNSLRFQAFLSKGDGPSVVPGFFHPANSCGLPLRVCE